jgi:hypothetical protein
VDPEMNSLSSRIILRLLCGMVLFSGIAYFASRISLLSYSQNLFTTGINENLTVDSLERHNSGCPAFDPLITPKKLYQAYFAVVNDSMWRAKPAMYKASFEELHSWLFGIETPNLYEAWPNFFQKKPDDSYPHTSLTSHLFKLILKQTDLSIHFLVEIGSFWGKSATNIANVLRSDPQWSKSVLLCIDTWDGGSEPWVDKNIRQKMQIRYGRSTAYDQFLANIIAANLTRYVLPYATTSSFAAYFLLDKKIFPQIIYLDSGHLDGETYIEMELYWLLLQPGGILLGDDWSWPNVRCDILRFVYNNKVNLTLLGNTWFIKKDKAPHIEP